MAIGNVIESAAQRPVIAEGMEAFFDVRVEYEPGWEATGARRFEELLLIVDDVVGEAGAKFGGVGEVEALDQRKQAVREESIGSIPGIRAGLLRTELRIVDAEVEDLIAAGAGADVRTGNVVTVAEGVTRGNLDAVVVILAGIQENEVAVGNGWVG